MPHSIKVIALVSVFFLFNGCSEHEASRANHSGKAITDTIITATYPDLYQAVFSRNEEKILTFTNHQHPKIRQQAWRALAQTPVDSLSSFIQEVKQDDSKEAWFALSIHEIPSSELRNLENYWLKQPQKRAGISLVLGQQGDEQTLAFLIDKLKKISGSKYESDAALAVSRLMIRVEANEKQQLQIINAAFSGNDSNVIRPWLYGFYRGNDETITSATKESLVEKWKAFGRGKSAEVDQYIAGIIGAPVFADIFQHYSTSGALSEHVQLGIELAQLIGESEHTENEIKSAKALLNHLNPHVVQQALANLTDNIQSGDSLFVFIQNQIIDDNQTSPFVWLQALNTLAEADSGLAPAYKDQLEEISKDHPYLYPQVLETWLKAEGDEAFLKRIEQAIEQGDPLKSMYAVNSLNDFWEADNKNQFKTEVRDITFDALAVGDRGLTFSTQSLLQDSVLFGTDDFTRINKYLNNFSLPGDIEVYQSFASLYKQRFEQQAGPVIDSLATLGYVPLNRSLKQAGWEVEVPDDFETEFRMPDWKRLWELGEHPVWVLETEKGTIKIEMNTLSAPATVSAIDSLTRAGAYDGVPFHRVVPNFVIQGGDIERRDGFGGPDFTIPTEPSDQAFVRGAAGIASAGPDTEGSQYFFMHQWKPHLNGGYTLFGNVIEGMDVVDRITVGDTVEKAYWE